MYGDSHLLDFETIIFFITISTLLALTPGPDNIFVLTQSMTKGARSGIFVTLGLCSGLLFHTSAVALGIATIFQTSIIAFTILKFIGACYLLYLAYISFISHVKNKIQPNNESLNLTKLYKRGVIMNITNPKVSIFFLAFLPQFINKSTDNVTLQIFALGAIFMFCALIVFSSIALLAGKLGNFFTRSKNIENILHKVTGTIFLGLAIKLAMSTK